MSGISSTSGTAHLGWYWSCYGSILRQVKYGKPLISISHLSRLQKVPRVTGLADTNWPEMEKFTTVGSDVLEEERLCILCDPAGFISLDSSA